jgi:hypothetical protein
VDVDCTREEVGLAKFTIVGAVWVWKGVLLFGSDKKQAALLSF